MKQDIKSMLFEELAAYFAETGERSFRAEQVFRWLHGGARSFAGMTDLPEKLREKLDSEFYITSPELIIKRVSRIDGTIKYLWGMRDGAAVESVTMEYSHGNTVCISSQVGCRMGCVFCASSIGGLVRDLAASEMLDQVMYSRLDSRKDLSNVVLMGIGEPLDNFDNVVRFLRLINHPLGMNIGARHISVSTCGIAEKIDKLAHCDIQFTLSASLHAPDDETRSRLMPINRDGDVDRLLDACARYFAETGRRVSYEYAMVDGVNDTLRHAGILARKLRNTGSHVNLIPLSDVPERALRGSKPEQVSAFCGYLRENGVNCTVRRSLGGDISASCGQLRRRELR